MISAILILATQSRAPIYLPDANLEFTFPATFTPEIQTEEEKKADRQAFGGLFSNRWMADLGFAHLSVKIIHFDQSNPPKFSAEQLSQFMFGLSKGMVDLGPEFVDMHNLKFTDRKLSSFTIPPDITLYGDSHRDLKTKTNRRHIAWQNKDHQVFFELSIDSDAPRIAEAIGIITSSIKLKKFSNEEAQTRPLSPQILPESGFSILAPAPFTPGTPLDGKTPTYSLRLNDGFSIDLKPASKLNIDKTISSFAETYKLDDFEVKATKTQDFKIGRYQGKLMRTDLLNFGRREYAIQFAINDTNSGLIGHIIISNDCGGKVKADEILQSIKSLD